ncbi:hypothetical protein SNEBB_010231 [Seison nebaliae]|nr:hypothetical protein SNEBB_010231 [Seison nebaliae]
MEGNLSKAGIHDRHVIEDVRALTNKYPTLAFNISVDNYVMNNGENALLFRLRGTIPINYQRAQYNIPIAIWLPKRYPNEPPICYVEPTASMRVRANEIVELNGRIYSPLIRSWRKQTKLTQVVDEFTAKFSIAPPVYSRNSGQAQAQQQQQQQQYQNNYNQPPYPSTYSQYPSTVNPSSNVYGSQFNSNSPYPRSPYYPTQNHNMYPDQQAHASRNTSMIETQSLREAVEQKLKEKMRQKFSENNAVIESLKDTEKELTVGANIIKCHIDEMEKEIEIVKEQNEKTVQTIHQVNKKISEMKESDKIDVEKIVITTAPVYDQLLNLFAEDNAIEDMLYNLEEALRKRMIDHEIYLKHVRELSRRQYMVRQLMNKCRKVGRLPPLTIIPN